MKVKNHKNFALFNYVSKDCKNPYKLGDIVIKKYNYDNEYEPEIGVVLQIHDDNELRTDMFGNACISELKKANLKQIKKYRNELIPELDTMAKDNIKFYRYKDETEIFATIGEPVLNRVTMYCKLGQHSEGTTMYLKDCKRVTLANEQVKELKKELESIGYKF